MATLPFKVNPFLCHPVPLVPGFDANVAHTKDDHVILDTNVIVFAFFDGIDGLIEIDVMQSGRAAKLNRQTLLDEPLDRRDS
jgi:hypothetical protein